MSNTGETYAQISYAQIFRELQKEAKQSQKKPRASVKVCQVKCSQCFALLEEEDVPLHEEWHQTMYEAVRELVEEHTVSECKTVEELVQPECLHEWMDEDYRLNL